MTVNTIIISSTIKLFTYDHLAEEIQHVIHKGITIYNRSVTFGMQTSLRDPIKYREEEKKCKELKKKIKNGVQTTFIQLQI